MSVIYKNGKYYGQEGGGSASFPPGGDAGQALIKNSSTDDDVKWGNPEEGRAKSSAIAPVFDEETTYAEGDRVTYEDELYVFNKAHTGAWDSADADKSDVDSEIPDAMSDSDLADVEAAFTGMNQGAPLRMMNYSTEEQVVGTWIDGKPIYQRTFTGATVPSVEMTNLISDVDTLINSFGMQTYTKTGEPFQFPFVSSSLVLRPIISSSHVLQFLHQGSDKTTCTNYSWTFQYTKTTD